MKNLLSGGTQSSPAVLGRVWQGHSLSKAMQDGEAERMLLRSVVWFKLLYGQTLHIHLEFIICYVLHPETQAFIEESSRALLNTEHISVIYCVIKNIRTVSINHYCMYIFVMVLSQKHCLYSVKSKILCINTSVIVTTHTEAVDQRRCEPHTQKQ